MFLIETPKAKIWGETENKWRNLRAVLEDPWICFAGRHMGDAAPGLILGFTLKQCLGDLNQLVSHILQRSQLGPAVLWARWVEFNGDEVSTLADCWVLSPSCCEVPAFT